MPIAHDPLTGWCESDGQPRWRSTAAALRRLSGADVRWLAGNRARPVRVAHLDDGTPVCVLRRHQPTRRWSVRIDGFEFWQHLRVMNREMWAAPVSFARLDEARNFVAQVLTQAGARLRPDAGGTAASPRTEGTA